MKVISEISLRDFEFWSGGADRANNCSAEELDSIEEFLEEIEPEDGWTDTAINDFFWFDFDTIAQHLGYEDEADFDRQHDPNYIDDDELADYCDEWFHNFINELNSKGDEESQELLGDIAYYCFNYDSESKDYPDYGKDNYNFLSKIHDNQTIFDSLFVDDNGESATDGVIPSLEGFRDLIMTQNKDKENE